MIELIFFLFLSSLIWATLGLEWSDDCGETWATLWQQQSFGGQTFKKCHQADCEGATLASSECLALILKDGDSGEAGDISSNTSISPVCLFPSFPPFTLISYSVKRSQAEKQRIGNSPKEFVLFLQR